MDRDRKGRDREAFNPYTPNDVYIRRTAPLTSRRCIYIFSQQIYVLNILNMLYIPFFSLQSAVCFIMLPLWFLYYLQFTYRVCKNI
jgi:hypothetical protein